MSIKPFETPSGEPGTGETPPITSRVSIAPALAPADTERSGRVLAGEVFDLGEGGRYVVKECLGRGGMGEVYRAEHVAAHAEEVVKVVALKVLRAHALPGHERAFIDEVQVLSLLRHDHIARYLTFFVDKGRQVLVMEYVDGRSLHSILELARRKGRRLSERTSLELLAQVANALGYAHAAKDGDGRSLNIVHRDVSPGNIMVDNFGNAVLVDFGVAKADLKDQTPPGSRLVAIAGKLPYMSPEQSMGLQLDGRSDVFAVGTVLVEMLTGEPPFGRERDSATLRSLMRVTPEYVDAATRGLSRKVRAICRKALGQFPSQRFADGREMATAMLKGIPQRSPGAVQEEIAALEALPDAPLKTVERVARAERDLRRVNRNLRALMWTGALAFAAWACFFFNVRMKPEAATPQAPKTAAVAPAPLPAKFPVAEALLASVPILTGTKAGDCNHVVQRGFPGIVVPDVMYVALDESNPEGPCKGKWGPSHVSRDEPCPVYDGGAVILRMTGDDLEERKWYGPPGRDGPKPSLLVGRTKVFDATGKYQSDFGHPLRDYSQRMTALITQIRTYDGQRVPVCGVLFGEDDKEGVPVFQSPEDGKPFGGAWGNARVKFFWP